MSSNRGFIMNSIYLVFFACLLYCSLASDNGADSVSELQQELSDTILQMQTMGEPENMDQWYSELIEQLQARQSPNGEPLQLSWEAVSEVNSAPKSVCFVVSSFEGIFLNSGIGTAYYGLAELLARNGHNVTVLYTRDAPASTGSFSDWIARYQKDNISFKFLPRSVRITNPKLQTTSYLVYNYLKSNTFDVVHFADFEGLGYYSTLSKRSGLALQRTTLIAGLHGPTSWILQANTGRNPTHESELEVDYMERHSVENADYVWTPSNYLASWLSIRGWNISANIQLLPLPPGPGIQPSSDNAPIKARELVFFGRLEKRKGLVLFCDAVDILAKMSSILPSDFSISFLGTKGFVDGQDSVEYVRERSSSWPFPTKVITEFTRMAALEYLSEKDASRLPVIPSLVDNAPYTVFECLYANIPFLASATPSIIPLLANTSKSDLHLFETKPHHLASRMINALKSGVAPATGVFDIESAENAWLSFYSRIEPTPLNEASEDTPLVSVCITHFNRPALVRQALQSVESQDYTNFEIILVDDGSNDTAAIRYLDSIEPYFNEKNWKIVRTENRYLGAARNTAAQNANGKYLIFLDDDNVAYTNQISTYVRVAQMTASNIVTAAHSLVRGANVPSEDKVDKQWIPLGDSLAVGLFKNCFGDANFFVEREVFQALGGFTEEYGVGLEEHEFFAKAVFAGHKLTVVPEPLLFYRMHDESHQMTFTTDIRQGEARRMRPYIQALSNEAENTRARRSVVSLVARNAVNVRQDCNATVTSISPNQGIISGGTYVTIVGSGFSCPVSAITIDGLACTGVHVESDTKLFCHTPAGNQVYVPVDVAVTIAGNPVVLPQAYTYTPLPAPTLQQCIVDDEGLSFGCAFSVPTNKDSTTPCANMLSADTVAKLGTGFQCVWVNNTAFSVIFGTNATLLIGDPVTVNSNTVSSMGTGGLPNQETTVSLSPPFHPVQPTVGISTPSAVGNCEGITLDASSSTGQAGRTFVIDWTLVSTNPPISGSVVADDVDAATTLILSLANTTLPADTAYTFKLSITNWLGQTGTGNVTVTKSSHTVPVVSIVGPAIYSIFKSDPLTLNAAVSAGCGSTLGSITYSWTISPSAPVSSSTSSLNIPANTLTPDTTYTVTVTATDSSSGLSNHASVTVDVGVADIVANIVGGNQQYQQASNVALDASSSYDPDNLGPLSFAWSCNKFGEPLTPCSYNPPPTASWDTAASNLGVGKWTYTVTVTGTDSRTATASVYVEVTETTVISVSIDAVQSPTRPDQSLTLVAHLNSANVNPSDITWSWSLVSGSLAVDPATAYPSGTNQKNLIIAANALVAGSQYQYQVTATHTSGAMGTASTTFSTFQAPSLTFPCPDTSSTAPEGDSVTYSFSSPSGVTYLLSFQLSGSSLQIPLAELSTSSDVTTLLPAGTYTVIGTTYNSDGVSTSKSCPVSLTIDDVPSFVSALDFAISPSMSAFDIARISASAQAAKQQDPSQSVASVVTDLLSAIDTKLSGTLSPEETTAITGALLIISNPSLSQLSQADVQSAINYLSELIDQQKANNLNSDPILNADAQILSNLLVQIPSAGGSTGGSNTNSPVKRSLLDTTSLFSSAISVSVKLASYAGDQKADGENETDFSTDNVDISIFRQSASTADAAGVSVGPDVVASFGAGFLDSSVTGSLTFVFTRIAKEFYGIPSGFSSAGSPLMSVNVYSGSSAISFTSYSPALTISVPDSALSTSTNPTCFRYQDNAWTTDSASVTSSSSKVTCSFTKPASYYGIFTSGAQSQSSPSSNAGGVDAKVVAPAVVGGVAAVALVVLGVFGVRKYKARQPAPVQPAPASQDPAAPAATVAVDVAPANISRAASLGGLTSNSYDSRSYSSSYATSSSSSEEEVMEAEIKNIVGELTHALPKDARALEVLGDKLEME